MITVSVVIVTLDRAESLRKALSSLAAQTRRPDEVIIVDNGSVDHTREVVLSFKNQLNVKYIVEGRRGIPFARNAGLKNASSEIIAFTDSDCVVDKDWLLNLLQPFQQDPRIGIVGGLISSWKVLSPTIVDRFCMDNLSMLMSLEKSGRQTEQEKMEEACS